MKPQGKRPTKPEQKPLERIGRHTYRNGLDLETKTFSASGRGGVFFLTSLFIELIELCAGPKTDPGPVWGGIVPALIATAQSR
jgi:hypothetical protein